MDFIKVYERIRESGMEAEWGTLNNGLPQISVRVLGITFFVVQIGRASCRERV